MDLSPQEGSTTPPVPQFSLQAPMFPTEAPVTRQPTIADLQGLMRRAAPSTQLDHLLSNPQIASMASSFASMAYLPVPPPALPTEVAEAVSVSPRVTTTRQTSKGAAKSEVDLSTLTKKERQRLSSASYRQKKKDERKQIEDQLNHLRMENARLKGTNSQMRDTISRN
ncbi:hypothetical protein KIPB_005792, partial [Kipferlia bialata]|eukprot:g5792.t1